MKRVYFVVTLAMLSSWADSVAQAAEAFPERPLRYIVAFTPGGASDSVARIVADGLTRALGQHVVVDNRSGASGTIGAEVAAKSTPDGYTLFACNIASLAVSPALYRKLGYDPAAFVPVGMVASNPNALSVTASLPAMNVEEFVTLAKSKPGKLNYGSAGVGTSPQLSMELFKLQAGIDVVHVPYRGIGTAIVDLSAGQIQSMFSTVPSVLGAQRSGKVRVLGVTSRTRAPDLPDAPTIEESGMPGFEVVSWQGLCTPPGVSKDVLMRLRAALAAALAAPETGRRLGEQGFQLNALDSTKFAAFIGAERAKWSKLVKDLRIEPK
jgi:tripartite-type tricarboxylate transporter receptor subunit TctC